MGLLTLASQARAADAVFGFSGWAVGYLPTAVAIERLKAMGYDIEVAELGGNSNQLQAAATGDVDITAIAQVMDAMDQGLDSRFFMGANTNEFILVSKADLKDCKSLDGRTVGIQSTGSFVGQLAIQWLAKECPDAKPNLTVIEGSDNRLAALLAGQLDSSVVDLQDWTLLNRQKPGEFTITADFTKVTPILRAAFAARQSFIAENPKLIEDWIRVHLDVYAETYKDPKVLLDKGKELLGEVDPEALPPIIEAFTAAKVWPVDGGISDQAVQQTIDFFNSDGQPFEKIKTPADVIDRGPLDKVLAGK
ncbi:ABC transporter substrate-binding protein [Oryzicola mucosus]|uniref:ABC transporter substrate-binding protein n=1 Tax=Oryzicola mucosus TaxID=2767425 RepID=A0A8J6Q0D1_9HYPH|nr:ABC transporter substrate-binding protein [Oryzicola mucosus]MBD0413900.1 ABC transporter substrate-binding protein [Oryzicola mucosus]